MTLSPLRLQRLVDLLVGEVAAEERVVEVDDRQVSDLAGDVDRVEHAARIAVAVGGISIDIGGEMPDSCAELLCASHDVLLRR